MWKIRKVSLQSGLELMTSRMIDKVLTNWTQEAGLKDMKKQDVMAAHSGPEDG